MEIFRPEIYTYFKNQPGAAAKNSAAVGPPTEIEPALYAIPYPKNDIIVPYIHELVSRSWQLNLLDSIRS